MLEWRIAHPFDVVCNNLSQPEDNDLRFAVWMTNEGDAGCQLHNMGDREASDVTRNGYYIFRGAEHLLFDHSPHLLRLEPSYRQEALDVLAKELSCTGWREGYFRETAGPFLGL